MMAPPLFPIPMDIFAAKLEFNDFFAGEFAAHATRACACCTGPLNHPNRATGYRLEHDGKALAYITDTEHEPGKLDNNVLRLVDGADAMIYDAPTPTTNTRRTGTGATRPGRKACAWPTPPR